MIATLLIIALMFAYLGIETKWFTIRLLVGKTSNPKYARYVAITTLRKGKPSKDGYFVHEGNNLPAGYSPNGEPEYIISLNPGIDNVLCGWEWLDKHCADLVDYVPEVSMHIGNIKYDMTIKKTEIIKDIMRVNKLSKKQKMALSY